MKKTTYICGSIDILVGAVLLCITSFIKEIVPILGRLEFQAAAAGSYDSSDYIVSFEFINTIAILLIVIGAVQILVSIIKKKN